MKKPFNVEEAEAGAAICTRSGDSAKFIAYVPEALEECQIIALVGKSARLYYANGFYWDDGTNELDLFMAPQPYEPSDEECKQWLDTAVVGTKFMHTDGGWAYSLHLHLARYALKREHDLKEAKWKSQ